MNANFFSIKRINKDIKEIIENPIEGIGIESLNNDIMNYVVNIMLLSGPYKGYCLQLLLTFPDNYPIKPPKILIYPKQLLGHSYHHHIFDDDKKDENGYNFKKLCFDLLDNDFMSINAENTGWNPSYTISTLLMQVQSFLSEPDLPENNMPKLHQIDELFNSMNNYEKIFIIKSENGQIVKKHNWKEPYPKMYFKENKIEKKNTQNKTPASICNKNKIIKENLTCFISKLNILDDPSLILGYPIVRKSNNGLDIIPEILSYEGYINQLCNDNIYENDEDYPYTYFNQKKLKSSNNKYYNAWLPIYINKSFFELNKQTILNAFSIIKFGDLGKKEYDFKPEYIFEIIFNLFNKINFVMENEQISSSYLRAIFQYILLYKKLSELYPKHLFEYYTTKSKAFNSFNDINYSFIATLFSSTQMLESYLLQFKNIIKQKLAIRIFKKDKNCVLLYPEIFIKELEENNLFNKLIEIMRFERNLFLYNGKNIKKLLKKKINNSFKNLYNYSDDITKEKLEDFLSKNVKLYNHIDFDKFLIKESDSLNIIADDFSLRILIWFYIRKIINKNNFIEKLEENYGVFLEINEILEELNKLKSTEKILSQNTENLTIIPKTIKILMKEILNLCINFFSILPWETTKHAYNEHDFENFIILGPIGSGKSTLINAIFGINYFNQIENPILFDEIEMMSLNNLKYLYLYCMERLKKCINPENKKLSFIESLFINQMKENTDNYEWYNYIKKRKEIKK